MDRGLEIRRRVERVVASSASLDASVASRLAAFVERVASVNAKLDLTAARTDDELVDLMLADALELAARLPQRARVVDVGAGAGAPGLALSIARPDLRVTLVEPLQKRVSFLRVTIGMLAWPESANRPTVVRDRGEAVLARGETFDVAISRATLPPPAWLALGLGLAQDVWVLLAQAEPPTPDDRAIVAVDVRYLWPLTGVARRAVQFSKPAADSPERAR